MKIEGYVKISEEEFKKLSPDEGIFVNDYSTDKYHYFKKVQKFPIVFEDNFYKIIIDNIDLTIAAKKSPGIFVFNYSQSFPLLVKAVEKAKEVMKKNETD